MDAVRICKVCHVLKFLTDFAKDGIYYRWTCLSCYRRKNFSRNRARNYQNPEYLAKQRIRQRRWNKTPAGRQSKARQKRHQRENPVVMLADRLSSLLRSTFRKRGIKKDRRTRELLGYGPGELYRHLRWYINRPCGWCGKKIVLGEMAAIDHIVPLRTAKTKEEVLKLNALKNLRLLHAGCNLKKGGKLPL